MYKRSLLWNLPPPDVDSSIEKLSMEHILSMLVFLVLGCLVSMVVFLVEIGIGKCKGIYEKITLFKE